MYRQYENPYTLEEQLEEVRAQIAEAIQNGADPEDLIGLYEDEADLKDRINFAWQDDEYDCED